MAETTRTTFESKGATELAAVSFVGPLLGKKRIYLSGRPVWALLFQADRIPGSCSVRRG